MCAMIPFEIQKTDKNPAAAAILLFLFMGYGQAYNTEIAKAVVFIILNALSIFLMFFIIGFVTMPILWVWSMVDAYRSAQKINQTVSSKVHGIHFVVNGYLGHAQRIPTLSTIPRSLLPGPGEWEWGRC